MLNHAILFFVLALLAAFLAFSGVLSAGIGLAKFGFYVFLALSILSLATPRKVF